MEKHSVAKILQVIWERFLYENNFNYISYKFFFKFTFIPFLSFHINQKHESNFQQVGCLVTRNSFAVCSLRVTPDCKSVPNSTDFHKIIVLHGIPVGIIVSWFSTPFSIHACAFFNHIFWVYLENNMYIMLYIFLKD